MNKADKIKELDKVGAKLVDNKPGKFRLVHDNIVVLYFGGSNCINTTPKANKILPFNTEKQGLAKIKELGLTTENLNN